MRYSPVLALAFFLCTGSIILAQHHGSTPAPASEKPATLLSGMGSHHRPVTTRNAEAQKFFDQGLTLIYAFNHEEAIRAFKRAAELDPQMAMAHWGIALALGPNINRDIDPERLKAAYEAAQKALSLAANASENERAFIEALSKRYSLAPGADLRKLAVDYKNAMGEISRRFPDDLDAATLYAESAMNLRPWQLWTSDGKPAEGTEEIVAVLESVLKRDPHHIGAIHYYIHAVEASRTPERALVYAPRLSTAVPAAGHLVHMPAHIYMRTGDYAAAAQSNKDAAEADEAFFKATGREGFYPLMYYNHNVHFLAIAHSMTGQYALAIEAARKLERNVAPHLKTMPMFDGFAATPVLVLVRFRKWDEILKLPQPEAGLHGMAAIRRFARGMAYAAKGQTAQAESERKLFLEAVKTVPAESGYGLNSSSSVLQLAEQVLGARMAVAQKDYKTALELLRKAVEMEDALAYDEPPGWFLPVRESLGGALMQSGAHAEAEKIFRADLERNARNGRSLYGLMESLKAQGKKDAAQFVRREFESAWKNADTQLRIEDL
jgi:tetratricopeptide (TPR) repeat protein